MPRFVLADYRVEFAHKFLKLMNMKIEDIPLNKQKQLFENGEINKLITDREFYGETVFKKDAIL